MKKLLIIAVGLALAVSVAGCATPASVDVTPQNTQVTYAQACAAYAGVFATALQLRKAGRLNPAQIDQVTLLDSQITPICTGSLPADTSAAVQRITSAVTTLTLVEVALKAN